MFKSKIQLANRPAELFAVLLPSLFALLMFTACEPLDSDTTKERIESLKKRAESGDAWAQDKLGSSYEYGKGVEEDDIEAAKWYRKAAEQGYASAQSKLVASIPEAQVYRNTTLKRRNGFARQPKKEISQRNSTLAGCISKAKACQRTTPKP